MPLALDDGEEMMLIVRPRALALLKTYLRVDWLYRKYIGNFG